MNAPRAASTTGFPDSYSAMLGITAPKGFRAAGVAAGLKANGNRDLALVVNDGPKPASAGVFTSNRVVAAPVVHTRELLKTSTLTAVVLNSGGANACTGEPGLEDAQEMGAAVAVATDRPVSAVGVCSTGLIGERLPMDTIFKGITAATAALSDEGGHDAADAIRTTDTVSKQTYISGGNWSVGGMAKGAGMLAPGLATMLCVITTDAVLDDATADAALREAVRTTFNRTDSDGCMSTNDTVLLLASGASGETPDAEIFQSALTAACADLARQLIADAEGASHDVEIKVKGATTEDAAEAVARAVARSNLFKAAIFGNDPNWGRVVAEVGTVPEDVAPYDPSKLDVKINGVLVCHNQGIGEPRENVDMTPRICHVTVDLHAGDAQATVWTNDLTHDYVEENSAYSS